MRMTRTLGVGMQLVAAPAMLAASAFADAATVERRCSIQATGDACIFDLVALSDGELTLCTEPDRVGDRWRATLVRRYEHGAESAVGTGQTGLCTGSVQLPMQASERYSGVVTWSAPSETELPRSVVARFDGPIRSVSEARPNTARARELGACSSDPQRLSCGSIVACELNPSGDTDLFTFEAPADSRAYVSIRGPRYGTYVQLFGPDGGAIGPRSSHGPTRPLLTDGQYALEAYNYFNTAGAYQLSLQGISSSYRCGIDISYGETRTAEFASPVQVDAYHVLGRSDHTMRARIAGPNGTYYQLFDPDGEPIGGRCGGACSAALGDGVHTLVVYNYFGNLGEYSLTVHQLSGSKLGVLPR